MRNFLVFFNIFFTIFTFTTFASTKKLTILTEEWSPYNYMHNGKISGFSTEILDNILKDLNVSADKKLLPWASAYKKALATKNALLYTTLRTKEREYLFKWAGPIGEPRRIYFYKLKKRVDINIKSLNDVKKYIIGGVIDDAFSNFLLKHGLKKGHRFQLVINEDINIKKLFRGSIDLMAAPESHIISQTKKLGLNYNDLEKVLLASDEGRYYFAFSTSTDDRIVNKFQELLKKLKEEGTYSQIMNKYFSKP